MLYMFFLSSIHMHRKVKLASVKYFTKAAYAFWLVRSNYSILAYRKWVETIPANVRRKEEEIMYRSHLKDFMFMIYVLDRSKINTFRSSRQIQHNMKHKVPKGHIQIHSMIKKRWRYLQNLTEDNDVKQWLTCEAALSSWPGRTLDRGSWWNVFMNHD